MKIDVTNKDPYAAVIDAVRELTREDGYEVVTDRVVRLKTFTCGESNEFLVAYGEDGDYSFITDWYEGGEVVELLGVIDIDKIHVPPLKEGVQ